VQSISIDGSNENQVIIRRQGLDGRSSEECVQRLLVPEGEMPFGAYYALGSSRRLRDVMNHFEGTGIHDFLVKQLGSAPDTRVMMISGDRWGLIHVRPGVAIAGDGPEQMDSPRQIGSLIVDSAKLPAVFGSGPTIFGRFHNLAALCARSVSFDDKIPLAQRAYLQQIAELVDDGGAGSVLFTTPDAFTSPALDVVLDLQAARMLAAQVGLKMSRHLADAGGVAEIMTRRESAIRRAAIEFVLLSEVGEAELFVDGDETYEIVQDTIQSIAHSAAEADAFLGRYVHRGLPKTVVIGGIEKAMKDLNSLVGLAAVKAEVEDLRSLVVFQRDRIRAGFKKDKVALHLVFTGSPGTGKTTVARLIGDIYRSLELLQKGHLVEVGRSDLVGAFIGQTEEKTQKVIDRAMDGVLFIDEAYSLAVEDSKNDFGRQAIEILLTAMENHADRLAVIVAGYPDEMKTFINANPGLYSRFAVNHPFLFEDYDGQELTEIYHRLALGSGYNISEEVLAAVRERYDRIYANRDRKFGNGRMVRNDYQRTIKFMARRHESKQLDLNIRLEDIRLLSG
jgi:hypothetical protein